MNLEHPTIEQLSVVDAVAAEYRAMWASLRGPPFMCDFAGTRADIEALDFIDYEAGFHPKGLLGAALVWGNVLAQTGLFRWAVTDRGDYLLQNRADYPRLLLWPFARVVEINATGSPELGRYEWLLEEAVARCLTQDLMTADQTRLLSLLRPQNALGEFAHDAYRALKRIRKSVKPVQ